jgi:hypothetical protein
LKFFICIAIAFLTVMCSESTPKPTEADASRAVEKTYSSYAQLTSFRKTNGQLRKIQGVEIYKIDYEAEIEYTKSGIERNVMGRFSSFTEKENPQPFEKALGTMRNKGDRRRIMGSITFEKTEKGWRPVSGRLPPADLDGFATMLLAIPIMFSLFLGLIGISGTILWIWMIIDCATKEPQGTDKVVWILVILLTHFVGALIYLLVRRPKRIQEVGGSESSQPKKVLSRVINFKRNSPQSPLNRSPR